MSNKHSCSLPVESLPYGGHCRPSIPSCLDQSTTPELSSHLNTTHVSGSESAFTRRFDPIHTHQPESHTPQHKQGGGSKRRNKRRQRRRSLKHNATKKKRQRRRRRSSRNRKRGGDGFRFDLSACPSGGMPDTVRYSTNVSDFY